MRRVSIERGDLSLNIINFRNQAEDGTKRVMMELN